MEKRKSLQPFAKEERKRIRDFTSYLLGRLEYREKIPDYTSMPLERIKTKLDHIANAIEFYLQEYDLPVPDLLENDLSDIPRKERQFYQIIIDIATLSGTPEEETSKIKEFSELENLMGSIEVGTSKLMHNKESIYREKNGKGLPERYKEAILKVHKERKRSS
ncbi:hypothetical protein COU60_04580 [Candidatus Pacearchaeota archaeon CG10_big_fil_rev_8_21_14_0_10_34_76]|nr:MAG: hypothetical protein COU60_04580 [Candidatus Pacearchaeota archaeon CG10_big_fil_rev_8_21_14_0_10_34_76]